MPLFSFEEFSPRVDDSCFIAPTATLAGDVALSEDCAVMFGAIIRGDVSPVVIGAQSVIMENAAIRGSAGLACKVGRGVFIGSNSVVVGAEISNNVIIGPSCVILEGAVIGGGCVIAAGSLVSAQTKIPPGQLVSGNPATTKRPVAGSPVELLAGFSATDALSTARRYNW